MELSASVNDFFFFFFTLYVTDYFSFYLFDCSFWRWVVNLHALQWAKGINAPESLKYLKTMICLGICKTPWCWRWWSLLFSAILHFWEDSLRFCHTGLKISDCHFLKCVLNIHPSGVLTALFGCHMAGATWNCCRLGASSVYTTHDNNATVYSVTYLKPHNI